MTKPRRREGSDDGKLGEGERSSGRKTENRLFFFFPLVSLASLASLSRGRETCVEGRGIGLMGGCILEMNIDALLLSLLSWASSACIDRCFSVSCVFFLLSS